MKKLYIIFALMLACSLSYAGLSVSPSVVNVSGVPNSYCKCNYKLTSTYENPVVVNLSLSEGNSFSGNGELKVSDWLKFEKNEISLKPGETVDIPFEVFVNENMKGSVCGRVDFSAQQSSMINLSISVPVYVTVSGTENIDFKIDTININRSDKSLHYRMSIKNDGNVHIRHHGNIKVYDSKKEKELSVSNIEETVPTYCEKSRDFDGTFSLGSDTLKNGKYVAVFTIEALGKQATKEVKFKVKKNEVKILEIK